MAPSISPKARSVFIWSRASQLADLAHGKADMDQHPVARHGPVVLQQAKINPATDADYIDQRRLRIVARDFDDLSWYG